MRSARFGPVRMRMRRWQARQSSTEALGQSYTVAYTEMTKEVPDAKLLGMQTTSTVFANGSPQWMYLFGSKDTKEAYTVFMGAPVEGSETPTATVAGYGPFNVTNEDGRRSRSDRRGRARHARQRLGLHFFFPHGLEAFGIATGMIAGVAIAPFIASHIELLPWVSLLAVMLILLVTQWAMTDRKISTLWGLEKLDPRAFRRQSLDAQLAAFAEIYRLTGRETDVLRGLLDRKTPQAMADEMVVSVSTVRSHIKSLYAKCSVHSKEEMARLFNEGTAERS